MVSLKETKSRLSQLLESLKSLVRVNGSRDETRLRRETISHGDKYMRHERMREDSLIRRIRIERHGLRRETLGMIGMDIRVVLVPEA